MLSVRRRQEDARGGGGAVGQLRAMDDDAELEEGEACGDDTAFVDPDVALSYIVSRLASSTIVSASTNSVPASTIWCLCF
jgi:hypothetical protein